jgi:hypothetical protein
VSVLTSIVGDSALGVYKPNGKRVLGGAERGAKDLYLYTFQLTSLADQLGRGRADYSSFDQEAALLNALKIRLGGAAVTGPALEAAVAGGLERLKTSSSKAVDRLGLIVRDLGTRRHINWRHPPPSSAAILDPVQRFLILVDIARPLIHAAARHAGDVVALRTAGNAPGARAAACESHFTGTISGAAIAGRFALGAWKTGPGLISQFLLDGVMGTAFAYSFHVDAVNPTGNITSFGTSGPESGTPLDFKVKTRMLDDLSKTVINCGSLVGYTVPGKGPLSGVTIQWDQDLDPSLGNVACDSTCTTTGNDGIATLHYQPYDEYLPGQGPLISTTGTLTASAYPSRSNGNILGAVLEALGINKFAVFGWTVSYHDPGGYKVDIPPIVTTGSEPGVIRKFTTSFANMESCDVANSPAHTPGNPLKPWPGLGSISASQGPSTYNEDEFDTYPDGTGSNPSEASGSAGIQMGGIGYDPGQPSEYGYDDTPDGSIGGLEISGAWVFDSTGLHAQITWTRQGVSPASGTLYLPVTRATDCG